MAKKRTPMNKIKEVLRLKYDCGLSNRGIASCLKLGPSTISELLTRFKTKPTWLGLYPKVAAMLISRKRCITARKPVAIKSCQTSLNTQSNSDVKV